MPKYYAVPPSIYRYQQGIKLAGVLYLHRISDNRMSGTPVKNFKMFRKLCGDSALQNVIIVTNMWGEVNPQVGEEREAELMGNDIFFKPAIEKHTRIVRHENTVPSAKHIIRLILGRNPLPLQIQRELVDEGKDITQTHSGRELNRELDAKVREHMDEIQILKEEMQKAIDVKDEETRREKEAETRRMQEVVERLESDARRFASDYKRQKKELEQEAERRRATTAGKVVIDPYLLALMVSVVAVGPAFILPRLGAAAIPVVAPAAATGLRATLPMLGRAVMSLIR